jgi:hypothetical protein
MLSGIQYIAKADREKRKKDSKSEDNASLSDLVRQEKLDSIARRQQQKELQLQDEEELQNEYDDLGDRKRHKKQDKKEDSSSSVVLGQKLDKNCLYCIQGDRSRLNRHLVMAIGLSMYLLLPQESPLVEGECWISSLDHFPSRMLLSSAHIDELYVFQRRIVRMFEKQKKGVIFIERVGNIERNRHWIMQCIPIKRSLMDEAPIYFKKAILEADTEWNQNKKLIETHMTENPVQKQIPSNFPYFSVQFGLGKGFAHPIEDERLFDWKFGKEVICAILDEPAQFLLRNKGPEEESLQKSRASSFVKMWQPFDWTIHLDGGQY